jgi:hypothetical protein
MFRVFHPVRTVFYWIDDQMIGQQIAPFSSSHFLSLAFHHFAHWTEHHKNPLAAHFSRRALLLVIARSMRIRVVNANVFYFCFELKKKRFWQK